METEPTLEEQLATIRAKIAARNESITAGVQSALDSATVPSNMRLVFKCNESDKWSVTMLPKLTTLAEKGEPKRFGYYKSSDGIVHQKSQNPHWHDTPNVVECLKDGTAK